MPERLHDKYEVIRLDDVGVAGEKHFECSYFVLDLTHDPAAILALIAYSDAVRPEKPELAADLDALIVASKAVQEAA